MAVVQHFIKGIHISTFFILSLMNYLSQPIQCKKGCSTKNINIKDVTKQVSNNKMSLTFSFFSIINMEYWRKAFDLSISWIFLRHRGLKTKSVWFAYIAVYVLSLCWVFLTHASIFNLKRNHCNIPNADLKIQAIWHKWTPQAS